MWPLLETYHLIGYLLESNGGMEFLNFEINKDLISAFQTFVVIFPATLLTYIVTYIRMKHLKRNLLVFLVEFIVLPLPMLLNLTVLVDNVYQGIALLTMIILSFYISLHYSHLSKTAKRRINSLATLKLYTFITNARATINLLTAIAILAVDFNFFPSQFMKTKKYGFSLMDVGVGLFVYSNGIVAPKRQETCLKIIRDSTLLFILGIGRYLVTKEINYHVAVWEYGLHWNFFITLGITKVFSSLIIKVIGDRFLFIIAPILLAVHEALLQYGLASFVFSHANRRENFIVANREGIVSSLGYIALYLLCVPIGQLYKCRNITNRNMFLKLTVLSTMLLTATAVLHYFFGTSRTLANSSYCCWVLFLGVFMTETFFICEWLHKNTTHCKYIPPPLLSEAVNYNGLAFFLLCNLLTGFVNIVFNTKKFQAIGALSILSVYLLICCASMAVLFLKQIRLKL